MWNRAITTDEGSEEECILKNTNLYEAYQNIIHNKEIEYSSYLLTLSLEQQNNNVKRIISYSAD